ncbi:MAG: class I SAM-dependent methyltransferase [Roseibium sp.]|uniref:class I SAM-dependent methyltransferase n=1 Tax=Roseibium sp. TaxID=1936156 RepID=UPI001B2012B1|nr:class I SAM-dependent methyltransferase [Roseibium sp.]MBO6893684.1 class I SAM-dependent methyltransferase [Roseibium sp.]MBO6928179.1 class I SAM-dependent methyltransferase [Roseibium sp.]
MTNTLTLEKTDTAHLAWEERWQTEEGRADWLRPDEGVAALVDKLMQNTPVKALDLGCGVGRHALAFARAGFETHAMDLSEAGLEEVQKSARAAGLEVATHLAPMTELPFEDNSFDYVLSFNVIYHGDPKIVRTAISEITRVLKPGGLYQGTMLSKRNSNVGIGTEVAPGTWVREGDGDKNHPHFYCNAAELIDLFGAFELCYLEDREHSKPGSWHWHLTAESQKKG